MAHVRCWRKSGPGALTAVMAGVVPEAAMQTTF